MTGRWSKSYLHRRWPKTGRLAREQPAGRDHNKSHEVIYIYIYIHTLSVLLSEEFGRTRRTARGTSDSAASRLSVVTSKPARGHQPPKTCLTRVSTMINRRPGSKPLSTRREPAIAATHVRNPRDRPPPPPPRTSPRTSWKIQGTRILYRDSS